MHEIHQYDIQKNGELIDTLECYLNHKQSILWSFQRGKDEIHNIKNIGIVIKDNESHG